MPQLYRERGFSHSGICTTQAPISMRLHSNLRKAFKKALAQTRSSLLYGPPCVKQSETIKMVTKFSAHHNQLCNLLSDHWHLLKGHHILGKYVKPNPELVFRRATSLRDRLTSSHYRVVLCWPIGPRGTFPCGHCSHCPWAQEGTTFILPNGELFSSPTHANCGTREVEYLMVCTCNAFFEGKTIRELRQIIGDHLSYSSNGQLTTIGPHISLHHRYQSEVVKFRVLEVMKDLRGGDWDRSILRRETIWIERLNTHIPPGLNEVHSYKSFL